MKKFLVGLLSLALVVVLGFSLAACGKNDNGKLDGKTYEANDLKIVFAVYKTNEDGTVYIDEETEEPVVEKYETLTLKEVLVKNLLATKEEGYTLTDEDNEQIDEDYKTIIETYVKKDYVKDATSYAKTGKLNNGFNKTISFKDGVATMSKTSKVEKYSYFEDVNVIVESQIADYEYKDGVVTLTSKEGNKSTKVTNDFTVSEDLETIDVIGLIDMEKYFVYIGGLYYSNFAGGDFAWQYAYALTVYTLVK